MKEPAVFLFRESNNAFELYFGEFSTSQGLRLFDDHQRISVNKAGGKDLSHDSWFNESDLSEIKFTNQLIEKLEDPNLDFVDLEIEINDFGTLTTHDDGECHFSSILKTKLMTLVEKVVINRDSLPLVIALNENPNKYIVYHKSNNFITYKSFDEYLNNLEG